MGFEGFLKMRIWHRGRDLNRVQNLSSLFTLLNYNIVNESYWQIERITNLHNLIWHDTDSDASLTKMYLIHIDHIFVNEVQRARMQRY